MLPPRIELLDEKYSNVTAYMVHCSSNWCYAMPGSQCGPGINVAMMLYRLAPIPDSASAHISKLGLWTDPNCIQVTRSIDHDWKALVDDVLWPPRIAMGRRFSHCIA